MKKTKSYFGNRFKSAVRGFRAQRSAKKEIAATSAIATSEFEALEPRVLLSGVGKASTSKSWIDADGDKVVAKIVGKGAGIQVDVGDGKFIDAANINIVGGDNGALSVVVSPVGKMTNPVTTKVFWDPQPNWPINAGAGNLDINLGKADNLGQRAQGQWYNLTPGYTNIGSITAETSFDGTLTAPATIASINLSAVVVPVIDLGDAAVGNINLNTGRVAMVDSIMANNAATNAGGFAWTPGLGGIDLFDITAGSVDQINIASPGVAGQTNDYLGTITMTEGGLNRLTGTNSTFNGSLIFEGKTASLGNVVLGGGFAAGATITALGDLTFQANGFAGVLDVGGHLNVAFKGGFAGTIIADGGVSGLRADKTDTIIVTTGNISGQVISGGDIADIVFNGSTIAGGTLEAKGNIGTLRFDGTNGGSPAGTVLATGDVEALVIRNAALVLGAGGLLVSANKVGTIDVANNNLIGSLAVGEIGDVIVRGGDITAQLVAQTNGIGSVTVELGHLTAGSSIFAQGGDIGEVNVLANDGAAAIAGAIIAEAGDIKGIDATNVGAGAAIGTATIFASGNIDSIDASTVGGVAIGAAKITALGSLGPITAIAYGGAAGTGAINGLTLVSPTIGDIKATSLGGAGIWNSTFISTTGGVGSITGQGLQGGLLGVTVNSAAGIGNISGSATQGGAGIGKAGAVLSTFVAQNGNIGTVTGDTNSVLGTDHGIDSATISANGGNIGAVSGSAFAGSGIFGSAITALSGNVDNVTGVSDSPGALGGDGINTTAITALKGKIGNITGTSNGSAAGSHGIDNTGTVISALTGIGTITGTAAQAGNGINNGTYTVTGPGANIDAVVGNTNSGIAISGATFNAVGGTISKITATPTGAGGRAIDTVTLNAGSLGDLSFNVTNLAGGYAVNVLNATALSGNIGNITVKNDSLAAGAYGIAGSTIAANKGNIGNITVTTDGAAGSHGISLSTFNAAGDIGAIDVRTTGNGSNGIQGGKFTADSDTSGAGNITSIYVKTEGVGSSGITYSGATTPLFAAQNITGTGAGGKSIEIQIANIANTEADAWRGQAAAGYPVVLNVAKNVGTITIANSSKNTNSDGLENLKLTIGGTLGAVSIATVGGTGVKIAKIDPTSIESLTITSANTETVGNEVAIDAASEVLSTGTIGNVTIVGNVSGAIKTADTVNGKATTIGDVKITGDFTGAGTITAGTDIKSLTVIGDARGNVLTGQEAASTVAVPITATTVNALYVSAGSSATKTGSIGNITITGNDDTDGNQSIRVDAFPSADGKTGGTIGNIEAKGLTTKFGPNPTLTVEVLAIGGGASNALSLGNITVDVAGATDKGNLSFVGGATLTSLGSLTVDGTVNVGGTTALNKLTTLGTVNVGAVISSGGAVPIGNGAPGQGIAGANNITIAANAANPGNVVTFNLAGTPAPNYSGLVTLIAATKNYSAGVAAGDTFQPVANGIAFVTV